MENDEEAANSRTVRNYAALKEALDIFFHFNTEEYSSSTHELIHAYKDTLVFCVHECKERRMSKSYKCDTCTLQKNLTHIAAALGKATILQHDYHKIIFSQNS